MMAARRAVPAIAVVLLLGACGGDDSTSETTSAPTEASPTTSTSITEMTANGADTSGAEVSVAEDAVEGAVDAEDDGDAQEGSDTTLPPAIPPYEVIHRLIVDDRTTLVILVEPGAYSTVQLENLVYDVVDTYSPNTAIVVDDRAAADLAIKDDLSPEEQSTLDDRTFLRIENGVDVTFHGPYADAGGMTVGS
jgi:hypothetical protein